MYQCPLIALLALAGPTAQVSEASSAAPDVHPAPEKIRTGEDRTADADPDRSKPLEENLGKTDSVQK